MKIPSITQIVSWHRSAMSTRADLNDCPEEEERRREGIESDTGRGIASQTGNRIPSGN